MMFERISVVGLGKLGACMAATMASHGADVIGVDVNSEAVEAINTAKPLSHEPGLAKMLAANRARLRATASFDEAVLGSEVSFIIVPTPSDATGGFSIRYVEQAVREIGRVLREKSEYHLIVLTSTVLPGATEFGVLPLIEESSGKVCGKDFGLCYNPEFIALGSVIHDLLNPDFILIGESDERAGEMLGRWYETYCANHPPVRRMNFVNAELTKLAVNNFLTMKITYANMLAAMCEELPGADVDVITDAMGSDSRIGRKYLTGGLGPGGPCFPRDTRAMAAMAQALSVPPELSRSIGPLNDTLLKRQVERLQGMVSPGMTIAILGLAYKPDTAVIEGSQSIELAQALAGSGVCVAVYDALAMDNARVVLGDKVQYLSLRQCLQAADVIVIATPAEEFCALKPRDLPAKKQRIIVFDCWRAATSLQSCDAVEYVPLGHGREESEILRALAQAARKR
jgi:UDPglucose 6-dehydrogenase